MKENPEKKKVRENMEPNAFSGPGFLGADTRGIDEIIAEDAVALESIGVSREALAAKMRELTALGQGGLGAPKNSQDGRFEVTVEDTRGRLPCPFRHNVRCAKRNTTVNRLDSGACQIWTDLGIHLIEAHGYFQGRGAAFRLEPVQLAEFLGLTGEPDTSQR